MAGEVYRRIFGHRHVVVIQHHNLSTRDWLSIKKQHSQIKFKIVDTYLIQKVLQESKFSEIPFDVSCYNHGTYPKTQQIQEFDTGNFNYKSKL